MSTLRFALGLFASSALACSHAPPVAPAQLPSPRSTRAERPAARRTAAHKGPCNAKYNGKCFASPDDACAAAGCADQRCDVLESDPPRVTCDDMR